MKTTRPASAGTRKRQAAPAAPAPEAEEGQAERAADAPSYQTFTVRFVIDPAGACLRTEVSHVQAGASEAWAGADEARLARWLAERIRPLEPPAPPPPAEAPRLPVAPALRELALVTAGATGAQHSLTAAGEPITARLVLELPAAAPAAAPLAYRAQLFARDLGGGRLLLGEARGYAEPGAATAVEVPGRAPAAGIYRISAAVSLEPPDSGGATIGGGLLHIYENGGDL